MGKSNRMSGELKTLERVSKKREGVPKGLHIAGGIVESVLSIPVLGWSLQAYSLGILCLPSIALGIVSLCKNPKRKSPHVLQIIAGSLGIIPVVGWIMHVITMIFLWDNLYKE